MSSTAPTTPPELPVGLLGGTFDPIHNAHLRLAQVAVETFGLERVLFIPTGQPWHRSPPQASPDHRVAMVRLAIADTPAFELDDDEVRTGAPGYTLDTLIRLRRRFGPRRPLLLLLGADAFLGLAGWQRWQTLFDHAHIGVATRPGHDLVPAAMPGPLAEQFIHRLAGPEAISAAPAGAISPFILSAGTVSATEVRTRRAAGDSVADLLPATVVDYIDQHHLYPD